MAILTDNANVVADGDAAFYRVDTFRPPHELPAGTAADAVNKRFEDGRAWPRFGINQQPWGLIQRNAIPAGATWGANNPAPGEPYYIVTGLVAGQTYQWLKGDAMYLSSAVAAGGLGGYLIPSGTILTGAGAFVATTATMYLFHGGATTMGTVGSPVQSTIIQATGFPQGFSRFNDPQGFDTLAEATDDWRDLVGEDGGRGRVWKIQSGNAPVQTPMNGHDVWGICRFIPCHNGLVLLRQDDERHYFSARRLVAITSSDATADTVTCDATVLATGQAATVSGITGLTADTVYFIRVVDADTVSFYDTNGHAVAGGATGLIDLTVGAQTGTLSRLNLDPTNSRILLNAFPAWADGEAVLLNFEPNSHIAFTGVDPASPITGYYVKNIAGNMVELYTDSTLGTKITFTDGLGKFYLQRTALYPGFYGNGAPPLLAQPNELGNTLWDVGFVSAPASALVTTTDATADTITVPNHRLVPGDAVNVTLSTDGALSGKYAYPLNDHVIALYATAAAALANTGTRVDIATDSQTGTVVKAGASGQSMPSGREGFYADCNRLVIVNGRDTLAISDPLDPLHFTPFEAAVTANLGESDNIQSLVPLGADTFLVLKQNSVHVFSNLSAGPTNWTLVTLTREYGCLAPLSVAQTGADVWFLSRKGVVSIQQTQQGILQGVAEPVSKPMKKYIDLLDWRYASQAVGCYWNNRYVLAFPLKGQSAAAGIKNNGVLSHNFLNALRYAYGNATTQESEGLTGWEGLWQGDRLKMFGLARHVVYGEERLCFLDYTGQVSWLGDGFTDGITPIADQLLTRRYTGGNTFPKIWLEANLNLDSCAPSLTVSAVFPGVNETAVLVSGKTYDRTKYGVYGPADYNPAAATSAAFNAPYREDYQGSAAELLLGAPDQHQNHPLPLRLRRRDWGMQLLIANAAGSARLESIQAGATQRTMVPSEQL